MHRWFQNPTFENEKRLLVVEATIVVVAAIGWTLFTDRSLNAFRSSLFLAGAGAVGLGMLIMMGAWTGSRSTTVYDVMKPSLERAARQHQYVKRAYGDLNVLAMAGALAIIVSTVF